jgi:hypothetical protein
MLQNHPLRADTAICKAATLDIQRSHNALSYNATANCSNIKVKLYRSVNTVRAPVSKFLERGRSGASKSIVISSSEHITLSNVAANRVTCILHSGGPSLHFGATVGCSVLLSHCLTALCKHNNLKIGLDIRP